MPAAEIHTTVTAHNAVELADRINAGYDTGDIQVVNGHALKARFRGLKVAQSWGNGTVSVTVEGRGRGKVNTVYIKVGAPLTAR
jgi:hypothetical protein